MKGEREFGADCVRILVLGLLLWLHFYLRNGFYYKAVTDFFGFSAVLSDRCLCAVFRYF